MNVLSYVHRVTYRRIEYQGCQMAKFDPFLSLDCARVEGVEAQSKESKERKGSNFAIRQPFSQIKEDTPSYHRSYNFFIERFSSMCHVEHNDPDLTVKIRLSGLQGPNSIETFSA